MAASTLCVVHCLALPLLIVFAPFLSFLETGEETHQYLAAFAVLSVLAGLLPGCVMHRRYAVLVWGIVGLSFITSAAWMIGPRFGEVPEIIFTVAGAVILFTAHLKNRRHCLLCLSKECPAVGGKRA